MRAVFITYSILNAYTFLFILDIPLSNVTEPDHAANEATSTSDGQSRICCILLGVTVLVALGALGASGVTLITLGWELSNDIKMKTDTALLEILPDDTVLLYQGDASDLVITEMVPPDENRPNIQLYVVDCGKLMKHKKHESNHANITLHMNTPLPIPSYNQYPHYELGSLFNFSVEIVDATEHSYLTIFIFDNTTRANEYTMSQTPESRQQAIKQWSIPTDVTNKNTTIISEATYGAYFVPVFSFETSGVLEIEFSYMITRQFYQYTDYITYEYMDCSLIANGMCSLNLTESYNKTCVLAYNQATLETYQGSVILQTATESSEKNPPQYKHCLRYAGYVAIGLFGVFFIFLLCT